MKIEFPTKNRFFTPLGSIFLPKITSDSDSSSKNTLVWVNPKFKKVVFAVIYFDFCEKTKNTIFLIFWFFTKIKIKHYKKHFFEFRVDLYRRIFWRGIRIWRYFLKKVDPYRVKIVFFYRKPISENWVSNKNWFPPLGVNFMSKITPNSEASSKNTSV